MIVDFALVEQAVGTDLGGGSFTIEPYAHWLTADVLLSPPLPEGVAHPLYAYLATQSGLSLSLDEIFTLLHASAADGVMAGETTMELHRPLRVGATYTVQGRITEVRRKTGRRTGVFDLMTFRAQLIDADGQPAATATNTFVFPRRQSAGSA